MPDPRAFLSAARAAARLRPVVALQAGARQQDPSGRGGKVLEAALRRSGVLHVTMMAELLAAAEILTHSRQPRNERLMIVTNAIGPGQLAADHAVRLGLTLAEPDPAAAALLQLHLPPQPPDRGIIWTGDEQPTRAAEAVAMLSALPEIGGVAVILAPHRTGRRRRHRGAGRVPTGGSPAADGVRARRDDGGGASAPADGGRAAGIRLA